MRKVNLKELDKILNKGDFIEVRGPKPNSYEYKQARNGLNDKKLWQVI
jgi:hypothetical protein